MFTQNRFTSPDTVNSKSLRGALVALSALVLLQGCKTMETRAQAFGEGIIRANAIHQGNQRAHRDYVDWQNSQPQSRPLPFRQPAQTQQNTYLAPAQTSNPSQQFLNQGMWSIQGN